MYATLHAGTAPVYNNSLPYIVKSPNPELGSVLIIDLQSVYAAGTVFSIEIFYYTSPTGNAFSWLTPE